MNGWGEGREALSVGGVPWAFFAGLGAGAATQGRRGGVLQAEGPNEKDVLSRLQTMAVIFARE